MGGLRKLAVMLLAVACAAALAACGGSDSSTSSTASTTTTTSASTEAPVEGGGNEAQKPKSGGGAKSGEKPAPAHSGSGGGSSNERSASFRTPGGDNSIQNFGEEAGAEERAKATATIRAYYSASENQEWGKVCGLLSAKNLLQLKEFSAKIPKVKSKNCAGIIQLVNASNPGRPPDTIKGPVVSLRRKGNDGFALYHGIDGKPYSYTLVLEGGEWKLTGLGPTPLSI